MLSRYQNCGIQAKAAVITVTANMARSSRHIPDAVLLRTTSLRARFNPSVACFSTFPCCANCSISSLFVVRIVVERAPGQKTTSKPAPEGIIKVEVWSSNAAAKGQLYSPQTVDSQHTITVRVWADFLDLLGVEAWLTRAGRVVLSGTAILGSVVLCARRKAGVELGPLDVVVWIGIDAVSRLLRGVLLQIPGTPSRNLISIHVLVKR